MFRRSVDKVSYLSEGGMANPSAVQRFSRALAGQKRFPLQQILAGLQDHVSIRGGRVVESHGMLNIQCFKSHGFGITDVWILGAGRRDRAERS